MIISTRFSIWRDIMTTLPTKINDFHSTIVRRCHRHIHRAPITHINRHIGQILVPIIHTKPYQICQICFHRNRTWWCHGTEQTIRHHNRQVQIIVWHRFHQFIIHCNLRHHYQWIDLQWMYHHRRQASIKCPDGILIWIWIIICDESRHRLAQCAQMHQSKFISKFSAWLYLIIQCIFFWQFHKSIQKEQHESDESEFTEKWKCSADTTSRSITKTEEW